MDFESEIYRLEGTKNEKGGLIVNKKPAPTANFEFKVPKVSLLGLDKLAVQRRKEREEDEKESKRSKLTSYKDDEDGQSLDESPRRFEEKNKKHENYKERHYRKVIDETPTHTGGLSKEARERLEERLRRNKERGIYSSSSKKHNEGRYDRDKDRESSYKRRGKKNKQSGPNKTWLKK